MTYTLISSIVSRIPPLGLEAYLENRICSTCHAAAIPVYSGCGGTA
ncbi:hypothetical protein HUB98_07445 [Paenibacillus barcinonensis]|uniref:Uncharacterized protein n=1 Tax=Paenibacillus barcinonensis TaxID=198119 RepID=A0ABX6Q1X7_PAEBA|nr:hypothetical protein [Paenibacillus barcinonensis]QKS56194.1 hypothetical protein HUB98_07445 [Paenibacillus barcinonensis]